MRKIAVVGIGTDVGKTFVSLLLTEQLKADYWKPIQCGVLPETDADFIRRNIANNRTVVHPEGFVLQLPASPHQAAQQEDKLVQVADFKLPHSDNDFMVIEGAGGILVPLNGKETILDLMESLNAEVVLVSRFYLGSINHTLLSIQELKHRKIKLLGIVYNGEDNPATREVIEALTGVKTIARIPDWSSELANSILNTNASTNPSPIINSNINPISNSFVKTVDAVKLNNTIVWKNI